MTLTVQQQLALCCSVLPSAYTILGSTVPLLSNSSSMLLEVLPVDSSGASLAWAAVGCVACVCLLETKSVPDCKLMLEVCGNSQSSPCIEHMPVTSRTCSASNLGNPST